MLHVKTRWSLTSSNFLSAQADGYHHLYPTVDTTAYCIQHIGTQIPPSAQDGNNQQQWSLSEPKHKHEGTMMW
jgi:hypothetical protein